MNLFRNQSQVEPSGSLPEEYLRKRKEQRANFISIVLFVLVMGGVATAFVVTNRNWNEVREARETVNNQFNLAGDQIASMNAYETRVNQMIDKAHVAVGLLDSVPKSNLVAEIVSRMPEGMSMIRFGYSTEEIKPVRARETGVRTISSGNQPAKPEEKPGRPDVRRWNSTIEIEGLSPSDQEVSRFIDAMVDLSLVKRVRLEYSREQEIDGHPMREFRIVMSGDPDGDIRRLVMAGEEGQ